MSTISIIGAGTMATAMAQRATAGGHTVEIIARDADKARRLADTVDGASVGEFGGVPTGDIVVLAVLWSGALAVVEEYGAALDGKVLVDITNPINPDATGFVVPEASSGAQEIARIAAGAHVVKAFNTLFAHVLAGGSGQDRTVDVFLAGDDAEAKARVSAFIESLGLRPLDAGPLALARALENAGLLEISLIKHSFGHTDFALGANSIS
jgi:8-hydroxy-5-deazaflavin:NADPH oxidoreductase